MAQEGTGEIVADFFEEAQRPEGTGLCYVVGFLNCEQLDTLVGNCRSDLWRSTV